MSAGLIFAVFALPIATLFAGYGIGRAHQLTRWHEFSERLQRELQEPKP